MPLAGHIRRSDTPGVGEYNPHGDDSADLKKSFSKDGSSMFAGSSGRARSDGKKTTTGENVGPGSYELDKGSIANRAAERTNPRIPGFGSSSVRSPEY